MARGIVARGNGSKGIVASAIVASWHRGIVLRWHRAKGRGPSWQRAQGHRGIVAEGKGGIMSDMAILGLAGFMFVGLPLIILGVAFAIDRLSPAKPESKQAARKHRAF